MVVSPRYKKYIACSFFIIVFSIFFNILSNTVKVHRLKLGKPLILTIDEKLSQGDYYIDYYVVCSGSKASSPVLEFSLKTVDNNGIEIIFENKKYSKAIGFGTGSFQIENTGDAVIAEFSMAEQTGGMAKSVNSASIGNIYIRSKDGTYHKTVYTPGGIGKPAVLTQANIEKSRDIQLSDFALLKDFLMVEKSLELKILCTKETSGEYELGLKIFSSNINAFLPDGNYYGFYRLTPNTDSWIEGEEYTQKINLNLIPGHYNLDLALSLVSPDVPYYINRYKLRDNKHRVNIGSIDIN